MVDFDKVRRCNLEIEHSEPIKDRFLNENHSSWVEEVDRNTKKFKLKYRKNMFTARTTTSTSKAVAGDTTKDDLIKEVRARKYRGGGIRLSDKDIFNPRYTFRKAAIKRGSINRKIDKAEVSKPNKKLKKNVFLQKIKF